MREINHAGNVKTAGCLSELILRTVPGGLAAAEVAEDGTRTYRAPWKQGVGLLSAIVPAAFESKPLVGFDNDAEPKKYRDPQTGATITHLRGELTIVRPAK